MNVRNIAKWATIFPALAFGFAGVAQAHRIVHVQGNLYVIVCDNNGGAFTFSGSQQGAGDVAGLLCPTALVGGSGASGPNTFEHAAPAAEALRKKDKGTTVTECPKGTHWYEPAKACVANGGHPN